MSIVFSRLQSELRVVRTRLPRALAFVAAVVTLATAAPAMARADTSRAVGRDRIILDGKLSTAGQLGRAVNRMSFVATAGSLARNAVIGFRTAREADAYLQRDRTPASASRLLGPGPPGNCNNALTLYQNSDQNTHLAGWSLPFLNAGCIFSAFFPIDRQHNDQTSSLMISNGVVTLYMDANAGGEQFSVDSFGHDNVKANVPLKYNDRASSLRIFP